MSELHKSLESSILLINKSSENFYYELDNKQYFPATTYKAQIWVPKSKRVYELTKELFNYIEGLKTELKKQSSTKKDSSEKSYYGEDKQVVKRLFINQKKGNELKNKIMEYRARLLCCDSMIRKEFAEVVSAVTQKLDTSELDKDFSEYFSQKINIGEALLLLTKLQNNIKVVENQLISFCNLHVADNRFITESYSQYAVIVGQSSSIVKPKETIVITSGVGSFTRNLDLNFIIAGREVKVNDYNQAVYKFKASLKSGKHFVPVVISYTDQDGKKQIIEQTIEYTVSNCEN